MLVLTHGSPGSPAVQQLFRALHELGPGRAHCGGLAILGDGFDRLGPIGGLAFLPEGLAVLAAHQINGAQGYLYAPLRGPWTVGGQVAHLEGGGSSPVAELDTAVKSLVSRVRRGGVDPGYVQSVVAVNGAISGVAQPEPERATGLVVTATSGPDLTDALRAATRQTSGGLAQAWTTADVRAVLEILGYRAADIDAEALSTEGFPYSPYVLRPTSLDDVPFSREERPTLPGGGRQLRSYGTPPPDPAVQHSRQSSTGPIPAVTPPVPAAGALPTVPADPANPGDLLVEPDLEHDARRSRARWIVPLILLLVVAVGAWFGGRALFASDGTAADSSSSAPPEPGGSATESSPATPEAQELGGFAFSQGAYDQKKDCAAYAYGDIKQLLQSTKCDGMERGLFLTEVDGKSVVITLAVVTMPSAQAAATLKSTADTDGTGNVNDLLRDGTVPDGYPAPDVLGNSEYASSIDGAEVRIVQAAYVDGAKTNAQVDAAADAALGLELASN